MMIDKIEGMVCIIDKDPTYIYGIKKLTQLKNLCDEVIDFQDVKLAAEYLSAQIAKGRMPHVILMDIHLVDHIDHHLLINHGEINSQLWKNISVYAMGTLITHHESERVKKFKYVTDCILKPTTEFQLAEILNRVA